MTTRTIPMIIQIGAASGVAEASALQKTMNRNVSGACIEREHATHNGYRQRRDSSIGGNDKISVGSLQYWSITRRKREGARATSAALYNPTKINTSAVAIKEGVSTRRRWNGQA